MKDVAGRLSGLFLTIVLVVLNAVLLETILDLYGVEKHRLMTGILGTSLIILSFLYSLRKRRKFITVGNMKWWLRSHEWLAIAGSFVIFVHTGTHFKALVPVMTLIFMFTAFVSGLIGRYVYNNVKSELKTRKEELKREGLSKAEMEQRLWSLTVTSGALAKWRDYHMPIVSILAVMVLYHALSALYYSGF